MDAERHQKREISRRNFLKLAAAAGLLAGCGTLPSAAPPTTGPSSPPASPSKVPTSPPSPTPSPTATTSPTLPPTLTPTPKAIPPKPEIIQFYPETTSMVIHTHHAGVWEGDHLVTDAIEAMLDASITALTGINDVPSAWSALFRPHEQIAIKINTIDTSDFWTHVPLVMAVAERLQQAGIPGEQIVIFDRSNRELRGAGYTLNEDGTGVRCYGTDTAPTRDDRYVRAWTLLGDPIGLSYILLNCDALINMPILKIHNHCGVTFAMKNHFGTMNRPRSFHRPRTGPALVELNAIPEIRDRTRLIIGDALTICPNCPGAWHNAEIGDSILMSYDPVAIDTVGLQILQETMAAVGYDPAKTEKAHDWLSESESVGLGAHDHSQMSLVELNLGA